MDSGFALNVGRLHGAALRALRAYPKISAATFPVDVHKAAAVITYLSPGLRYFHEGQFQGRKKHISPHLCRGPDEPINQELKEFYEGLLAILRAPTVRAGHWQSLDCSAAWNGNWTCDCFIAFAWQGADRGRLLVAVNYAGNQSQCYVRLPFADLGARTWRFQDRFSQVVYGGVGNSLQSQGLFLDLSAWSYYLFDITSIP